MRYTVKVIPRAKKIKIVQENGQLKVHLTAPAIEGRANQALIEVLAEHFNVKKRQIRIISGQKSRQKIVEVA